MRFDQGFSLTLLAVSVSMAAMSSGCAPAATREPSHAEASAESPAQTPPAGSDESSASNGGSSGSGSSNGAAGTATAFSAPEPSDSAQPFIAEARAVFPVIDRLSPGRLEVVNGCLTVAVRGGERATAVFPPEVEPQWKGEALTAVAFEGRTIPLDQETSIPGGVILLSTADLVKPAPTNCPKTLFGLGG